MSADLNAAQFQPALPGLEALKPQRGVPSLLSDLTHREFVDQSSQKYSGPIPGQMVMGVHDLGGDAVGHISRGKHQEPFYTVDPTGFVQELGDSGRHGIPGGRYVSPADIAAKQNVQKTVNYYKTYGGAHADKPHVQMHWAAQPLHQIPADAPVHTGQDWRETEWGHDAEDVHAGKVDAAFADGRQRINAIRTSLQSGEDLKKPAWLLKRSGRLYAMDGHHRVTAAREEGHATYPARVWDLDAEEKRSW